MGKIKGGRIKTDNHVMMKSIHSGNKKLISCGHIRDLASRGKLGDFPWKFATKGAAKIYEEWLAEVMAIEAKKAAGSEKPGIYGVSNESEKEDIPEKEDPKEPGAGKKAATIIDALKGK